VKGKALIVAGLIAAAGITPAMAGVWETQCIGCHNGSLAPSKAQLKAKFKDADALVKAAEKSKNPMMRPFTDKKQVLKQAAEEIFGK